jgi:hypothetical protein
MKIDLKLMKFQKELLQSDKFINIALCGRSTGKTYTIATMMMLECLKDRQVGLGSKVYSQVNQAIEELYEICYTNKLKIRNTKFGYTINGRGNIKTFTSMNPDNARGGNFNTLFIDEAAFVSEYFFKDVCLPTVRLSNPKIYLLSSPLGSTNWLSQKVLNPSDNTFVTRAIYTDNKFTDELFKTELVKEYENGSELTLQRELLGQIVDYDSNSLFSQRISNLEHTNSVVLGNYLVAGLDIGASEHGDKTAICVMNEKDQLIFADSCNTADISQIKNKLLEWQSRLHKKIDRLRFDSSGQASLITSELKKICLNTEAINFGSVIDSKYKNVRSQMYFNAFEKLSKPVLCSISEKFYKDLKNELLSVYLRDAEEAGGKICICPKDKIKERMGHSPDIADAFALACLKDGSKKKDIDYTVGRYFS